MSNDKNNKSSSPPKTSTRRVLTKREDGTYAVTESSRYLVNLVETKESSPFEVIDAFIRAILIVAATGYLLMFGSMFFLGKPLVRSLEDAQIYLHRL